MSDKEFGLTNVGTDGIIQVPVELKDHSKDPILVPESVKKGLEEAKKGELHDSPEDFSKFVEKKERTELEKEVDAELIAKGADAINDFDETQAIIVPAKKRGRKPKAASENIKAMKEWYCSTCREVINEKSIMKIGAGEEGRYAAFCGMCQRSLGFIHPDLDEKVANLIKNNPTGK